MPLSSLTRCRSKSAQRKLFVLMLAAIFYLQPLAFVVAQSRGPRPVDEGPKNSTPQSIPFTQNWSNTGLITTNDDWSGVAGIEGFLGQDLTTVTGTDPQTLLGTSALAGDLTVLANQTATTVTNGDVGEFHTTSQAGSEGSNSTIALQGSGTADAPYVLFHLNTTGLSNINVSYNLRDIDCTTDNSLQQVALQFRVGTSGNFTNVPAGYVADASGGPSLCTLVTPISVALPAVVNNQPIVQVRVMTTNAVGNDEWIGVDDINITSGVVATPTLSINDVTLAEGNAGTTTFTFTVSLNTPATSPVTFDIATQDNTATTANNDYVAKSLTAQTIPISGQTYTFDVTVNGDANNEPNETFFVNVTNVAGANVGDGQGVGTINNDDATTTPIYTIQGSGSTSPLVAQAVTTTGIVTGIKSGSSGGFFIQDPSGDANTGTSDGIFVFTGASVPAGAVVGNNVQVSGTVSEFIPSADPNQKPLTELSGSITVNLLSTGNPLPAPFPIAAGDTTVNNLENLERLEGMRVSVASLTVVAPTQGTITEPSATVASNGVFYGVVTGVARPFREPGINISDPLPVGAPANVPRFDENPERLRVDSDGQPGTTLIDVTSGTVITNVTGELDYAFRTYTILPEATLVPGTLAAPSPVPQQQTNEFTVGSFNMERFFDTTDDPTVSDPVLTATAFNNRLNKASLAIRNVMRLPDVLGVAELENLTTLQAVANKINNDEIVAGHTNPAYQAFLVEGNDVGGIDVGFLVKSARVSVIDVTQFGKNTTYINPNNGQPELLNDRPPLVLRVTVPKPTGGSAAFTVIVNHLRSLSGVDDAVDGNRIRTKRRAQAEFLADLIQARQTADPTEKIVSVGDYNAFQVNDGYVDVIGTIKGTPAPADQVVLASSDLVNPDLTDLVDTLPVDQRYSYSFDGNAQVLDHIIVNAASLALLNRFAIARNDADFPTKYYEDGLRSERLSDHDMPVAYFSLGSPLIISEFRFRGPTLVAGATVDGSLDEYVELYNNSSSPLTVGAVDGSAGWSLAYMNGTGTASTVAAIIPNGTVIPAQGHYLLTNEPVTGGAGVTPVGSYSLTPYAATDQAYGGGPDIPDNGAIAIFQTGNPANFSSSTRMDAVSLSSASGALATLFREGTNLASPGPNDGQYAYLRKLISGVPQDTDNNAQDFSFVSTNAGNYGGVQSSLGAPGPENSVSPLQRNSLFLAQLIEPAANAAAAPNRVRNLTPVTNGALGTLSIRRHFVNNTGQAVTRLRFRVVDITTLNSPGYSLGGAQADIRAIDGSSFAITTSRGALTVLGTTVEQPSPLLQPNGGGLNSSVTVAIPGSTLAPGAAIDLHFLLGVQQGGSFRFFINVEALP